MKYALDTLDGTAETLIVDEQADGRIDFAVKRAVDVQPTIDAVHASHMETGGWSQSRELRHVAEIPEVVLQAHAQRRGIANYMDLLKPEYRRELLSIICDPDFRMFSPSGGKV